MNETIKYPLMIPPVEKSFRDFTKADAKMFFDWYVAQSEERINQLQHYIARTNPQEIILDGTSESLVPLWSWYEDQIKTEKKTGEELKAELDGRPEWLHSEILKTDWKFTIMTYALAIDISFYLAKVFIINHNSIRWGFLTKPKSLSSVNRPVLLGFKNNLDLDPREIVIVCCRKSVEEKKRTRLFDIYRIWEQYIE